jgi:hypothetical protein
LRPFKDCQFKNEYTNAKITRIIVKTVILISISAKEIWFGEHVRTLKLGKGGG